MASPKVFVSSTCYDLKEIRDNLYEFIESLGYIPVFSDKNEVFYHPDLHTHEACLKEIENCQLFVLIIGGRFGGTYKYDEKKSIVNAEYDAAKKLNLPIFTFVQKEVYSNQFTYSQNVKNGLSTQIKYPAIADQKYAKNIFEFIISVRRSDENNGLFEFEFARDIKIVLKKQFAGLFYDFLWNRKKDKENEKTKSILYNLSSISKKTEELIENIYRQVADKNPNTLLNKLNLEDEARKFWYALGAMFDAHLQYTETERKLELAKVNKADTWITYLAKDTTRWEIIETDEKEGKFKTIKRIHSGKQFVYEWDENYNDLYSRNLNQIGLLEKTFQAYKKLSEAGRLEILNSTQN